MTRRTRRQALAARLLAAAAAHDRYAEGVARWVTPTSPRPRRAAWRPRRAAWRAVGHVLRAHWCELLAAALGYRRGEPDIAPELPAQRALGGAAVVPCATGHRAPAVVIVIVDRKVRGVVVPTRLDVCVECAEALRDAGMGEW